MNCRFCNHKIETLFVSLGSSPLANSYLSKEQLSKTEPFYPLDVYVCDKCFLVQLFEFESPENIFSDYAYFSSYSQTWLKHSQAYVDKMIRLFGINKKSLVIEIASNDGYLLQYFIKKGIPVLGIEPALNVAKVAQGKGIPTEVVFFGTETAKRLVGQGKRADLLLGNNVLAHVPNLNDFVKGLSILLKSDGIITMEFPHLLRLMESNQFDTIYQEHFSYFSFLTVEKVFSAHGLVIFDVEELSTHGGSLRIFVKHQKDSTKLISERVSNMLDKEISLGFNQISHYLTFDKQVRKIKRDILDFLIKVKQEGKVIVGYGAAAKGNTLLNYCGIRKDFIDYVVDMNPYKQGRYLPGSRIFIEYPEKIKETKPDYILILPWNIKDEVMEQLSFIRGWGGKFIVSIPELKVF
ncbi:MAG: SAM-dependent methyltransferase [Candidatus Omnitrophica bacterium CG11_big_fil_rev_8_21_14_0_20_41_12]|nr:MAG: SAM-dependent methyltransferase [Candidatus Omnitrophica bacterium CG11_big_fil_rev_8_21_14_0_20_41_12]